MPTCTVGRNRLGSWARSSAIPSGRSPFSALLQTAAPRGEDGDLRPGKKAVGEYQHQNDDRLGGELREHARPQSVVDTARRNVRQRAAE